MPKQRILRTGPKPLIFRGQLVARLDNRRDSHREYQYWHEVAIYQIDPDDTPAGHYVVKVTWLSTMKNELPHEWAVIRPDVAPALEEYDPLAYLKPAAAGEHPQQQHAKLSAEIHERWLQLAADVCAAVSHG